MAIQPRRSRSGKRCVFGLQRKLFSRTEFAGVPLFHRVWEICRVDEQLQRLQIVKRGHPATLLTFSYVLGCLLGSRCLRQLTDRWRTDEYLREQVAEGRRFGAHDWSRLLARFDFTPLLQALVEHLQSWDCTATDGSRGVLILDDTPLEKFGRKMQGAHSVYDHAKRHFVWGYPLVNLIYQAKRIVYPVGFRLQSKRRTGRKPKIKRTKIVLAMQLLKEAAQRGLNVRAVVFDPAYCAVKLLRHLDDIGYHWVTRLASNRVVEIDGERMSAKQLARKRSWFRVDPVRNVQFISRQGYLLNYALPVQFVVVRTPGVGTQVLVTSLIETPWQEIFSLYGRRFDIEVFHRDAKQYIGLADFRYRDLRRINNHIALSYIRYTLLALMRIVFPEIEDLSCQQIKRRVLRRIQLLHVSHGLLRILLPPNDALLRRLLLRYKLRAHPITS